MDEVEIALRREAARRGWRASRRGRSRRDLGRTRQWVAKWAARYDPHDPGWAEGRSRAPKRVANRTDAGVEAAGARGAHAAGGEPVGAGRRAGDRVGAFEARRGRAARAHDRGDPQARWRDPAGASRPACLEGDPVPGARRARGRRRGAGRPGRPAPPRRRGALPRAEPDRRRLAPRRDRDHRGSQRPDVCCGACTRCGAATACQSACSSTTAARSCPRPGSARSCACACARASRRCSSRRASRGATAAIEHFNDTFDKRFFRQERFADVEHLSERAGAFERFHNAQHRYSATRGHHARADPRRATTRAPIALAELPGRLAGARKVEFIRFIRSDHKLRILGRAITMPDGSAYQYVTATARPRAHH